MNPEPAHLLHVFSTFAPGGPQVRTAQLIGALGSGLRHSIVAMDGCLDAAPLLAPEARVSLLAAPPKAGTLASATRLRALLARERPDLLLTYNFGAIDALLAARTLRGLRAIHHEDGFLADEASSFKRRRIWLRRLAFPATVRVVVISRNLERIALELWRQPRERVVWIPNGIDVGSFARGAGAPALRRALELPERAIVAGSVGHLRAEKNLARLLCSLRLALEQGADLYLVVLGEGPERERLERMATAAPLAGRVRFVGYHADLRQHYRAMDLLLLSSDTEQMPLALIEAMSAGLPVVSTDVGDVRAMLPDEQQPLVVPLGAQCERLFSQALLRLARDAALRARLGALNLARARERFERASMEDAYRRLYAQALAG